MLEKMFIYLMLFNLLAVGYSHHDGPYYYADDYYEPLYGGGYIDSPYYVDNYYEPQYYYADDYYEPQYYYADDYYEPQYYYADDYYEPQYYYADDYYEPQYYYADNNYYPEDYGVNSGHPAGTGSSGRSAVKQWQGSLDFRSSSDTAWNVGEIRKIIAPTQSRVDSALDIWDELHGHKSLYNRGIVDEHGLPNIERMRELDLLYKQKVIQSARRLEERKNQVRQDEENRQREVEWMSKDMRLENPGPRRLNSREQSESLRREVRYLRNNPRSQREKIRPLRRDKAVGRRVHRGKGGYMPEW